MNDRKHDSKFKNGARRTVPNTNETFSKPHAFSFTHLSQHTKALFALALICFLWGTTWVVSKVGVGYMPVWQMAGIRQTIAGLCYVLYFAAKGATWPRAREWRIVVMLGILNFTLTNGLSTWGVKYISAGLGSIISAIVPLWLVLISFFGSRV